MGRCPYSEGSNEVPKYDGRDKVFEMKSSGALAVCAMIGIIPVNPATVGTGASQAHYFHIHYMLVRTHES